MQSHQRPPIITPTTTSIVEEHVERQIIPCKITYTTNDKSPILSSEFEFFNPLIKRDNKLNKKQINNKLKRTVSDFGKISVDNVRGTNDHQKKTNVKLFKSDYSLSKVAQLHQQQHLATRNENNDDNGDEISPLLLDTNTNNNNNLTIKVITDDKNVLLFTKKNLALNSSASSNGSSCEEKSVSVLTTISDNKDKENLVKYQKRQGLKLPLNGKCGSEVGSGEGGSNGTESKKNNWRHSWYAPVYGVLEEETETIKVGLTCFFLQF